MSFELTARRSRDLRAAARARDNAAEYVPMLAILMLLVRSRDPAGWMEALFVLATTAHFVHALATAAHLVHAFGILVTGDMSRAAPVRLAGAGATYVAGLALAVAALIVA